MKALPPKDKLIEKLAGEFKLDRDRLKTIVQEAHQANKSVFQMIADAGILPEEEIVRFLCATLDMRTLNLKAMRIPKETLQLVPRKIVERHQVVPLSKIHRFLTVATSDPYDLMVRDDLRDVTQCDVCFVLAPLKSIQQAIDAYYSESSNLDEILVSIDEDSLEVIQEKEEDAADPDQAEKVRAKSQDAPIMRMVNLILAEAMRKRASDVHFEPYEHDFRVRYRIDGVLEEAYAHSRQMYAPLVARIKIMSQLDITQKRNPQDGRFRARIGEKEIDFRVSILPTYFGEKVVLRILDRAGIQSGLDKLGFSERPTRIFAEAVQNPYGMILVTGPTGSGKSTTLYTILNTLNTLDRNLMTVEDPVEYQIEGITQTQVLADVGLTFANGLRALLRQSPDVILVGEIRDRETADIAVKAALTGHLVFSTLHTNSAAGAVTRLIDMGIEPFLIASSVICVAAQRLVRRICDTCKADVEIPDEMLRRCGIARQRLEGFKPAKGKGCVKCHNTGYYGRLGAIEILNMAPQIRSLIIQRKSSDIIHRQAVEMGMETLFENALGLFSRRLTTMEEVLRVTSQG